jgi:hypothetical protein
MQDSPGADPTAEVVGSGQGQRRLTLVVARHSRARWLAGVRVFLSYGGRFFMRFAPTGSQRQQSPATVRVASGEASGPRTCAKASLSSLLASRPTNCSDRRWKSQIWWLPRVWRVLDLRPKIRTICGAIYKSF